MFGDLRLVEAQPMDQIPYRPRPVAQEFHDLKTAGLGQRSESFHHRGTNMPQYAYSCQDIFLQRNIKMESPQLREEASQTEGFMKAWGKNPSSP